MSPDYEEKTYPGIGLLIVVGGSAALWSLIVLGTWAIIHAL